jgi:hypothetical protein
MMKGIAIRASLRPKTHRARGALEQQDLLHRRDLCLQRHICRETGQHMENK